MANNSSTAVQLSPAVLHFIRQLKQHNDRDWFQDHKDDYQQALQSLETFADALLREMNTHDVIETPSGKKSLHRIYRDTRFSTDKTPYKSNWSGGFKRATRFRRGGYYFHLEPGNSFVAGGFWAPVPADLKRVRDDIAFDAAPLRKILGKASFRAMFGQLQGEQVKTAPKGFDASHEAIDLLRFKQYLLIRRFTDEEVLSASFLKAADKTYREMRPFFDYMSEVLTGDGNGL